MLDRLPRHHAARVRRRHRGVGILVLLALIGGLLLARFVLAGDSQSVALREGLTHVRAAVCGDASAWAPAERQLTRAAHGAVFDAYPIFALELTRRVHGGDLGAVEPALIPSMQALSRGDLPAARAALVPEAQGHRWMARLLDDLGPPCGTPRP